MYDFSTETILKIEQTGWNISQKQEQNIFIKILNKVCLKTGKPCKFAQDPTMRFLVWVP